jgi:uncharacterized protein YjbJ (UPF0337 family)
MNVKHERAEGKAEKMGGTIKKTIGKLIGNERIEAEGRAKELQGQAHMEAGKTEERIRGTVEELAGAAKNRVGHLIDNEQMQVEGKLGEIKGRARQDASKKDN